MRMHAPQDSRKEHVRQPNIAYVNTVAGNEAPGFIRRDAAANESR
jgi:hypothetical protein